jgi:hypothetical protein
VGNLALKARRSASEGRSTFEAVQAEALATVSILYPLSSPAPTPPAQPLALAS